jgi:uncharacterized protein
MTISTYQASVPLLIRTLNNFAAILEKGAAYSEAKKIDPTVLINTRLYPDMFPLGRQVQIASDVSRRGVARLAGLEAPKYEDNETTFPELINRLQKTVAYLETLSAEQIEGSEQKSFTIPTGRDSSITLEGLDYIFYFILPNAYFHVTTAYNILRHCGVEVGKGDYLGKP